MSEEIARPSRRWIGVVLISIGAVVLALAFRGPLVAWFAGGPSPGGAPATTKPSGQGTNSPKAGKSAALPPLPRQALPPAVLAPVRSTLAPYERIRESLARDGLEGVAPAAAEITAALHGAAAAAKGSALEHHIHQAAEVSSRLGAADDLARSRRGFAELSDHLIALMAADPRLQEGLHVFECPMTEGPAKWFQPTHELENPYMGSKMLTCGSHTDWSPPPSPGDDEIAYYTCPMHPSVRRDAPGQCPICGMDLTPVTRGEAQSGTIVVDQTRRQRIGIKTAAVREAPLAVSVRAVGRVTYDETRLEDVTLRVKGWIDRLHVDTAGAPVRKGQPLLTVYSPELLAAEQELLLALASQKAAAGSAAPDRVDALVKATRQRLRLLGLSEGQIAALARSGEPMEKRPILAPSSGVVIEKDVVVGAAVEAGQRLYRIAPLDEVWIEADVYESDLPHVEVGQTATITLPTLPGKRYEGKVAFVYPYLEGQTRTGKVRVRLPNRDGALKPAMYADVALSRSLGTRLQVPASAVLYTGPRRLVFVDVGQDRLRPQEVTLGARAGEAYEVLSGLKAGDVVVTSGNFLIAAESRIRSAAETWGGSGGHAGH